MKRKNTLFAALLICGSIVFLNGCATPEVSNTNEISPDTDPLQGGISSQDVRTVASKMCPAILSVPEIAEAPGITRIKIAGFKNSSRFFIDRNLFMKRLSVELNRYGRGKIRFLSNNERVMASRVAVLKDRQEARIEQKLKQIAAEIAASPVLKQGKILKIAVIPVINTNLVNMNADSFTAMLRSEIYNAAAGKVQFLLPGVTEGADYYLTGQFISESMKNEGIINLVNYIETIDARVKSGKSLNVMYVTADNGTVAFVQEDHLNKILKDPAMRGNPNVNKRLNIMLIDPKTKAGVYEKMMLLDKKISDNSGAARLIISGEISGMHQRRRGVSSDYLLISVQLTDPETAETIWEDAYEVKLLSKAGIVYR